VALVTVLVVIMAAMGLVSCFSSSMRQKAALMGQVASTPY